MEPQGEQADYEVGDYYGDDRHPDEFPYEEFDGPIGDGPQGPQAKHDIRDVEAYWLPKMQDRTLDYRDLLAAIQVQRKEANVEHLGAEEQIRLLTRRIAELQQAKEFEEKMKELATAPEGMVVYFTKQFPSHRRDAGPEEMKTYHFAAVLAGWTGNLRWHITGYKQNLNWKTFREFVDFLSDALTIMIVNPYVKTLYTKEENKDG